MVNEKNPEICTEDEDLIDYMAISHQKVNIVDDFDEFSKEEIENVNRLITSKDVELVIFKLPTKKCQPRPKLVHW